MTWAVAETTKCSCYNEQYIVADYTYDGEVLYKKECRCRGTKERELCACEGDELKCDFYPDKRDPKQCPCCGYEKPGFRVNKYATSFYVQCPVCGMRTSEENDKRIALNIWNRRERK